MFNAVAAFYPRSVSYSSASASPSGRSFLATKKNETEIGLMMVMVIQKKKNTGQKEETWGLKDDQATRRFGWDSSE